MKKNKTISIVTIVCLASIVLIPIGLALMWLYTDWKKTIKAILSATLGLFYVAAVVFLLLFEPAQSPNPNISISAPVGQSNTEIQSKGQTIDEEPELKDQTSSKKGKADKKEGDQERLPSSIKKQNGKTSTRLIYSILFFLFMLFLVIWQNLRKTKKTGYENPYVDVDKYKLPLKDDSKMPLVHFLRLRLNQGERIYFATETTQKDNEGDFVITNQRVVIFNKAENISFPLNVLTAVSSVTDNVMQLTSGERKYYIFFPESQMKYALAVLRWSVKKEGDQNVNQNGNNEN